MEILSSYGEDAEDPEIPLLLWYAMEPMTSDMTYASGLATKTKIPLLREFIAEPFKFANVWREVLHFVSCFVFVLVGITYILIGVFKIGVSKKSD